MRLCRYEGRVIARTLSVALQNLFCIQFPVRFNSAMSVLSYTFLVIAVVCHYQCN